MPKHTMKPMTKDQLKKAVIDGVITKTQHDKLPAHLLQAIIKSKSKSKK
jgi:hypothetical protein